ncbi:aminotransferase class I/II-fold pyridoxal phosphate-dependent enzyme [Lachnobacterium bovis]|uniref:Arginine/lysine/ornithine decarboxylase n=1 Tax=Lachnobacterium bovis TaxID=140626 RepID=A0A1H9U060_9FIRM|nr:aminotransferase class V-fold PLP-dependent enzyme [Lachnobacterium bovis]SES02682.1 Arginine/lysine/ornithine decarboxylase [Lachnobacterium bovis]
MLYDKLVKYKDSNYYPFHMPGHKRKNIGFVNPYEIDITEIEGFDNLHEACDIIKESQDMAAKLYGAKETFYLINGSTCGILSAISAAVDKGGEILVARNSHKAVYNSIFLRELKATYVMPEVTKMGLQGSISPQQIEKELKNNNSIKVVVITSPTYDGIVSDVKQIAEITHKYGAVLIVDEAHGAHFGFSEDFPENAVKLGADIVIVSVHKTLAAFTQTALLHVCSNRVDISKVKKFLGIYETSSPSYILMSGIEKSLLMIKNDRVRLFKDYADKLNMFYNDVKNVKNLKIIKREDFSNEEVFGFDFGKILIFTGKTNLTGVELYNILLEEYHLQMEMCSGNYVVAMTSLLDTKEGFDRLAFALNEIDKKYIDDSENNKQNNNDFVRKIYISNEKALEIFEADESESKEISLDDSIGKISKDYVFLYPPGIPLLVPGEIISADMINNIKNCIEMKLNVCGLSHLDGIEVVITK